MRITAPTPRLCAPRALALEFLVGFLSLRFASCASTSKGPIETAATAEARYPRRSSGCDLAIYYTPVPGVGVWDDLGVAEAACHISDPVAECLRRLKSEACRLGGDMIYNVPRKPLRPRDQVLLYRGQVAHTRAGTLKKIEDPDLPPAASAEESAGPVVPLPAAGGTETTPVAPTTESKTLEPTPAPGPLDAR